MAVKDVREYYQRMTSDYVEMKRILKELETIPELKASTAYNNIDNIREQVKVLEANYNRLSYIIFLLDEPKRPEKKERYRKIEKKRLNKIPENDRKDGVIKENQEIIHNIQSFIYMQNYNELKK